MSDWRERASDQVEAAIDAVARSGGEEPDEEAIAATVEQMEGNFGVGVEELNDGWAAELESVAESGDDVRAWLMQNPPGVDVDADGPSPDSEPGGASPGGDESTDRPQYVTRDEAQAMVDEAATQAAREATRQVTNELEKVSPSGGGGDQGGGGLGQDQLAQLIAQKFLAQDNGAMDPEIKEAYKQAQKRTYERMARPTLGEQIGVAMENHIASQVGQQLGLEVNLGEAAEDDDPFEHGDGDESDESAEAD